MAAALASLLLAEAAHGQIVRGVVVEVGSGTPVEGAMVILQDHAGKPLKRVLTDGNGEFIIDTDRPGPHFIRVDRIGYESLTTEQFAVPVDGTYQRVAVPIHAVELVGIDVSGSRRCEVRPEEGRATARVWEEAEAQRREIAARSGWTQRLLLKLDPRIRTGDIQVRFEESGEVVAAGYVQAWRFRLPGLFVVAPSATGGRLTLDFVSGRLGRLPLPEFAFDWVGGMLARGIMLGQGYAEISELSVADGKLTFAARVTD